MSVDSLTINLQGEFTKSQVYQIVWRLCNIGKVTRSRTDEKAPWVYKLVKKTPQEDCDG